jgi:hypothetical protein
MRRTRSAGPAEAGTITDSTAALTPLALEAFLSQRPMGFHRLAQVGIMA